MSKSSPKNASMEDDQARTESDQTKSPLDVAIIGAGIGGLALAIGLLRQYVPYTLYEAAPQYSTIGAGVGVGPNVLRAMDMIDSRFRELYEDISTGNITPNKEHVMMDAMLTEEGFGAKQGYIATSYGAPTYWRTSAHRKALLNIMTSLIPLSTVKFNKRAKTIKQEGGKVAITFEDGEVVMAGTVIGCDGIKDLTRSVVLGPTHSDEVEATYAGKCAYRSIVPMKDAVEILGEHAGDAKMYLGSTVQMTTFPISKGTESNAVAFKMDDKPWTYKEWTEEVSREEMAADFAVGVDKRLVRLFDWAKPVRWSIWHHLNTSIYYNGLICLLGDSAHASTPHQAAGAGQCLEDALILSRLLARVEDRADTETAFKVYDSIRRPRAQKVVSTILDAGKVYNFSNAETGTDMNKILANLQERHLWIWEHDLEVDMMASEEEFDRLTIKQK